MKNAYQASKARAMVRFLLGCQAKSSLTRHQLAKVISIMSSEQWRTVAFSAGVAVADFPAKAEVLRILRDRAPHSVPR